MPKFRIKSRPVISFLELLTAPYSVIYRVLPQLLVLAFLMYVAAYVYVYYEGLDWISAFYAGVSLITTIGAYAPSPTSMATPEKLILTGVMIAAVAAYTTAAVSIISTVTRRQTWLDVRARWRGSHVKGHIVIVGDKPDVAHAASKLDSTREEYMVLTSKGELLGSITPARVILGDPLNEKELRAAGVDAASTIVVMMSEDDDALAVVLRSRKMNPNARILAELNDDGMRDVFEAAGAELVVSPYRLTGRILASVAISGNIGGFMLGTKGLAELSIGFFHVAEGSKLEGHPISEIPRSVIPLLIGREGSEPTPYFTRDQRLEAGMLLVVMGDPKLFTGLRELLEAPKA